MRKVILLLIVGVVFSGCVQKTIKKGDIIKEEGIQQVTTIYKEDVIKKENVDKVANIYKGVKTYKDNSMCCLTILAVNFSFELLVNDCPILSNYAPGVVTRTITMDNAILKSGVQTITLRMTPPIKEGFNMDSVLDFSTIDLDIMLDYGDSDNLKSCDYKVVSNYPLPKEGKLPYYEVNLTFNAPIVAYENDIIGWENSVDLSKENREDLLKEVEAFYREMIDLYSVSRDVNGLASKYYNKLLDLSKCYNMKEKSDFERYIDEWVGDVNDQSAFAFSGYEMKFYGNGRLVKLVKVKDKRYLHANALMRVDSEGIYVDYDIILHRPKTGAPLEIIR